ncbi:MAG: hypothetical protein QG596_763 [Actinomycetota bacterium]|jgi:signal transduction histidine kinase|nr:hypothetical protein [Actinomycetota bacterium]
MKVLPPLFAECQNRRDRLVYFAAFAIAVAVGISAYFEELPADIAPWHLAVVIATWLAGCLSLFYRRRWPIGVAVFTMVVGFASPLAGGAFLVALLNVVIRRSWKPAVVLTAIGILSSPVYFYFYPSQTSAWDDLIWGILVTGGLIAWGMYLRARRELLNSLHERARQAEADRDLRMAQAREQERTRIAREMHDVLAHRISLVALNAGALEFRPDASPEEIRKAAAVVRASAHQALDELRDVISVLREQPQGELAAKEPPQPTLLNVEALIEESRQAGSEVGFESKVEDSSNVPDSTGRTAYRVIQEGLTNFRKHAAGGTAKVTVAGSPDDGLTVEVRNRRPLTEPVNGADVPGIPGSGSGLIGLTERVELAGGRLDHGRLPDGQFRLRAWLPWT